MKKIIDKLVFIKTKNLLCEGQCQEKERQATNWEKIFAKDLSDKGYYPKYTKNS